MTHLQQIQALLDEARKDREAHIRAGRMIEAATSSIRIVAIEDCLLIVMDKW